MAGDPPASETERDDVSFHFLFLRVSPEDRVLYINTAFARYLDRTKESLLGTNFDDLRRLLRGEIKLCVQRPERGRGENRLVGDEAGRVFEARSYSENGVLDIVLNEVTHAEAAFGDLLRSTGTPVESLTEEELRILRHADRRFATTSVTRMRNLAAAASNMPPHDAQLMLDAFAEEAGESILSVGATVGQMTGDRVTGIFGSPRYHKDHAFRAVLAACLQIDRIANLGEAFSRQGRELPPCSIGIASGDLLLTVIDTGRRRVYSAQGGTAQLASQLARLARPGEVLLTESTLNAVLGNLPEGWESVRTVSEADPDLSDVRWEGGEFVPLAESLRRAVCVVGPGVSGDASAIEFYFEYLYALLDADTRVAVPILRVVRLRSAHSSVELETGNVVTGNAVTYLGRYRLVEMVGEGGMGKVWRAEDRFGNNVAVKVLTSSDATTTAQLQRFKREAQIMARLPHRNICRVFEFNEFEGVNYIAMEFVDGVTLSDLLYTGEYAKPGAAAQPAPPLQTLVRTVKAVRAQGETSGSPRDYSTSRILPEEQTLRIVHRICEAVEFAHEHGVLHRDLKPGNILLREDGEPLVADFGLAKIDSLQSASLSLSGHVVGTVENMAPEQAISSKDVDGRADVFSIGTILYQMLTGHKFFTATGNLVADAQALQTYTCHKPRALNRHIDPDLEIITMKALRPDRNDRYRTVAALRSDLERYERGELISAKPITVGELFKKIVQRNKAMSIVILSAAVVFVLGLAVAAWAINDRRLDAEAARRLAERARYEAEARRKEAEQAQGLAEKRQAEAEQALAEAERARKAEKEARGLHDEAVAKVEQYTRERAAAVAEREKFAKIADDQAKALKEAQASFDEFREQSAAAEEDPQSAAAAAAMEEALAIYQFGFTPSELEDLDGSDGLNSRLTELMERLGTALDHDPALLPALVMKGRVHLAELNIDAARATLRVAEKAAAEKPDTEDAKELPALQTIVASLPRGAFPGSTNLSALLKATGAAHDRIASRVLDALSTARRGSYSASRVGATVFGRELTAGEVAFALRLSNPPDARVSVTRDPKAGWAVEILDAAGPVYLAALKDLDVRSLRITGATGLDWPVLFALPVASLDLSGSAIQSIPFSPQNRGLLRLRRLNLSGTQIVDLREVAMLPLIEELDLSNTPVRSLNAISGRRLSSLNISGCQLASLTALDWMPLETLVVTPGTLPTLAQSIRLRSSRTLKSVRTPDDPETLTAWEFWKRLDEGQYPVEPAPPSPSPAAASSAP